MSGAKDRGAGHVPAPLRWGQRVRQWIRPAAGGGPMTVGEAAEVALDPATGRWSRQTGHGKEVARALQLAAEHWGADRPWGTLTRGDWRSLWRWRLTVLREAGHGGHRGTELVVQRAATVARWLVEEGHVVRIVGPEREWRLRLAEDYHRLAGDGPEPRRPRHTLEELRRILQAAEQADPRFRLLLALGAELRLGQVVRCRRRDLDLQRGTLTVRGRGRKRGVVVELTAGQQAAAREALEGYLSELEGSGQDYPLFPCGQLPGGRSGAARACPTRHLSAHPVGRRWVVAQFAMVEAAAGVPHRPGRGAYGIRRAAVDAVKALGVSREGLMAHGGWTDTAVPDRIYAEQQAEYARQEAARLRARVRNEMSWASEELNLGPHAYQTEDAKKPPN